MLRRLDCVLEETNDKVIAEHKKLKADGKYDAETIEKMINRKFKLTFHNTSDFSFQKLLGDPDKLAPNLVKFMSGFSTRARKIIDKFNFIDEIEKLEEANRLFEVVKQVAAVDLHPDTIPNIAMGYGFEDLVRRFNEQANEEAGDHFTPREVIKLMVSLLFTYDDLVYKEGKVIKIYDPTVGTGGMLSESDKLIVDPDAGLNPSANLELFGQEYNPEAYAICGSDLMIKGEDVKNIVFGNTLGTGKAKVGFVDGDGYPDEKFYYMLANPPFGVEWKPEKDHISKEHEQFGFKGRFGPGLPRINDGALLFLLHMISKMEPAPAEGGEGSRIAIVFNGSPLFTGDAGSGESAMELKGVLNADRLQEEAAKYVADQQLDPDEDADHLAGVLHEMLKRAKQPNLSFFAFTATPKYKTLKVFDEPGPNGQPPFHLYTMRQAIEEKFILDVLKNYVTYEAYFRLVQVGDDDPHVQRKKAARALARTLTFHAVNLRTKTEVMLEHFRTHVRHKIGGRAKAMVVTEGRLHAVRYKQTFDKYIAEKGYTDIRTLVAFSGIVEDPDAPGKNYTEVGMNGGIKESELPERFDSHDYQVLLVAEKYQTGFDQPLLHTMYVDKKLTGLQAVQTLSRLNRTFPGKEDTFILDFRNTPQEIFAAFKPYDEDTPSEPLTDAQHLYRLQHQIEETQLIHEEEVMAFCAVYFKPRRKETPHDHAQMNSILDQAVERFQDRDEEEREKVNLWKTDVRWRIQGTGRGADAPQSLWISEENWALLTQFA